MHRLSKGNPVNIPEPGCGYIYGNITELGDVSGTPGKSSLFFLTAYLITLKSDYLELGFDGWKSTSLLEVSGAAPMTLENPRERVF